MRDLASRSGHTQGYTVGTRERCKHPRWVIHHPQNKVYRNCIGPGRKGKDGRRGTGFTGTGVVGTVDSHVATGWFGAMGGFCCCLSSLKRRLRVSDKHFSFPIVISLLSPFLVISAVSNVFVQQAPVNQGSAAALASFSTLQAIVKIEGKLFLAKTDAVFRASVAQIEKNREKILLLCKPNTTLLRLAKAKAKLQLCLVQNKGAQL